MKLTCQRGALANAFQTVGGVVPSRTPKAILQNVKLSALREGAELLATDQEVGIRYHLAEVQVDEPGQILLPHGRISAILRELRDDVVVLESTGESTSIRSGFSQFDLPSQDAAEFPPVAGFDEENYYVVAAGLLREMIHRTIFATDLETSRYALGGILVVPDGERIELVATDSRRLALTQGACRVQGTVEARSATPVVPARAMALLERSLPEPAGEVHIALHANDVLFKAHNFTLYSRLLEGRFPRYKDVVPKAGTVVIELQTGPFHSAVRQAQIITNEESRGVDFTFDKGLLVLNSRAADVGKSRIELPISYDGAPLTIRFDPRFVADFLKVLEPERQVRLELTDSESAAVLRTDDGYTYVIMPLARDRGS